ncbi:MAG: hypothetical protein K8S54_09105 [Spirochaetia bacterium]|nr:hypothetical protein [Spirochaetia bacterium]
MKYVLSALLCLLLGIVALHGQDEFVPGESDIKESNILTSMERELGHEFTPKPVATTDSVIRPQAPVPAPTQGIGVKLLLGGGAEISGQLLLSDDFIVISRNNEGSLETRFKIPLQQISTMEFQDWKPGRILPGTNKESVVLFPTACSIERVDGSKISGLINPLDWLQLSLVAEDSTSNYRIYFKIERAIGEADVEIKEAEKGIVKRIVFIHEKGEKSNAASIPR